MRRYWFFIGLLALAGLGLFALGWVPTRRLGGPGATAAQLSGIALGVVAGSLSCLPAALLGSKPQAAVVSALGAIGLRFLVTVLGGASIFLLGLLPAKPLLVWIGISYLAFLPLETRFILEAAKAPS